MRNEALTRNGATEIFNTDQGSQFTRLSVTPLASNIRLEDGTGIIRRRSAIGEDYRKLPKRWR